MSFSIGGNVSQPCAGGEIQDRVNQAQKNITSIREISDTKPTATSSRLLLGEVIKNKNMNIKIEVTRIDNYEVVINENVWDKKALKEWGEVFWKLNDLQDLAKVVSTAIMRYGLGKSMEGFGRVKQLHPDGREIKQYEKDGCGEYQVVDSFTKGIEVIIHSEDDDYSAELDF